MTGLIIVDDPAEWPLDIGSAEVVSADDYLRDPRFNERRRLRLFNLCDSYRYQSVGYYVSLLATARGHRAMPSVTTIQDMKHRSLFRPADDLDDLIQRSLHGIVSSRFEFSIYFGHNLAERHAKLSRALFNLFPVPLMRASFVKGTRWRLASLAPIPVGGLPEAHRTFLHHVVEEHFRGRGPAGRAGRTTQYEHDLAILVNDDERSPPSNREALKRLERAARANGFDVQLLCRDDYGRLAEFDALFIRETTAISNHTYRFARRAAQEGMPVIDDPLSMIRCTNKVYLNELMAGNGVPVPPTVMISGQADLAPAAEALGFPLVLKIPDSAFSRGVRKAADMAELKALASRWLADSDLLLAQKFLPTAFDWRIGVLDGRPLFAVQYLMAGKHWQIVNHDRRGRPEEGGFRAFTLADAPAEVVDVAVRAARCIGDGLYGVDLKETADGICVIEVNDNPNLDHGVEDAGEKDEVWRRLTRWFVERLER